MSDAIGHRDVDAMTAAIDAGEVPLLGHLVVFNVRDSKVTPDELQEWFNDLALDTDFLPKPLRQCDAFEKVTGRGAQVHYTTEEDANTQDPDCHITLMVRDVVHERKNLIVRQVVREVRDPGAKKLRYQTSLADLVFRFIPGHEDHGAGTFETVLDETNVADLTDYERTALEAMLTKLQDGYEDRCVFLSADKVRSMLRSYLKSLNPVKIAGSGGLYFVGGYHAGTLSRLRDLMARFANDTLLTRIPLLNLDETRALVTSSLTTETKKHLAALSAAVAKAQRDEAGMTQRTALHRRYLEVKESALANAKELSTTLEDAQAQLELVDAQVTNLLSTAPVPEEASA